MERSLVATKLTMKEAQIVNVDDKQIISKTDNELKIAKDTVVPLGPLKLKVS